MNELQRQFRIMVDEEALMIAKIIAMSEEKIVAYTIACGLDPDAEIKRFDEIVEQVRARYSQGVQHDQTSTGQVPTES